MSKLYNCLPTFHLYPIGGIERGVGFGHTDDGPHRGLPGEPRPKDYSKNLRAVREDFLAVKFGLGDGFGICAGSVFGVCADFGTKPCARI